MQSSKPDCITTLWTFGTVGLNFWSHATGCLCITDGLCKMWSLWTGTVPSPWRGAWSQLPHTGWNCPSVGERGERERGVGQRTLCFSSRTYKVCAVRVREEWTLAPCQLHSHKAWITGRAQLQTDAFLPFSTAAWHTPHNYFHFMTLQHANTDNSSFFC